MSDNYEDILTTSWDEIPEPQNLPTGSWVLKGLGATFRRASEEGKSDQVSFLYEAVEPLDDVDADALEALGANYDYAANKLSAQFFVQGRADWDKVRKHLAKHGVDTEGLNIQESLKAFRGKRIAGYVGTRSYTKDGEQVTINDIKKFVELS